MGTHNISLSNQLILLLCILYPLMAHSTPEIWKFYTANGKRVQPVFIDDTRLPLKLSSQLRTRRQVVISPNTRIGSPVITPRQIQSIPRGSPDIPTPAIVPRPIDPQEEMLRSERINQGFERMLQFVTIAGQIDSYLSDRAKSFIGRLHSITNDDDNYRLQSRRTKCNN
uniref:DUF4794 domain-containing protein n=1 Tax=Clastoptera arizonana TaxID=38151 RepID=A0A1B6DU26_9HEMI